MSEKRPNALCLIKISQTDGNPSSTPAATASRQPPTDPPPKNTRRTRCIWKGIRPDPALQLSTGWMGASGITLVALAAAIILGIVFYGLNRRTHNETAPSPAASSAPASTAPAAPQRNKSNG